MAAARAGSYAYCRCGSLGHVRGGQLGSIGGDDANAERCTSGIIDVDKILTA